MPFNDNDSNEFDEDDLANNKARNNKAKNHPLTLHLGELTDTLYVLLKYPKTEDDLIKSHIDIIRESFNLIKAKLYSALRSDSYLVCMQNASTIRYHADYLLLASHTLNSLNCFDEGHVSVFRDEMEEFQQLFKAWAKEIKEMDKEDFEDEWGLF